MGGRPNAARARGRGERVPESTVCSLRFDGAVRQRSSTSRSSSGSGSSTGSTGSSPGPRRSATRPFFTSDDFLWSYGLEANWGDDPQGARRGPRAPRRAPQLPGHLDRPGDDHRRRPVEDVLPLRLRLPLRRQLRPLPRDRPARRRGARDEDGDVLDPRPAASTSPTTAGRTRASCGTTSALKVPEPREQCRIRVGDRSSRGSEGRSLIFDDTYEHEVWNDTDDERVVLFLDVVRPLRFPMNVVNWLVITAIARAHRSSRTRSDATSRGRSASPPLTAAALRQRLARRAPRAAACRSSCGG